MADLSAVLRKTIDGLPSATPQLRAKVYEKARAAVQRQIASADPPFAEEVVEARRQALEEAIAATEAHYTGGAIADPASPPPPPASSPAPAPVMQPAPPRAPVAPPPPPPTVAAPVVERPRPPRVDPVEEPQGDAYTQPLVSRTEPRPPERPVPPVRDEARVPAAPSAPAYREPAPLSQPLPGVPGARAPVAPPVVHAAPEPIPAEERVGEIGPVSTPPERGEPIVSGYESDPTHDDGLDAYGAGPFAAQVADGAYRPKPQRSRRSLYVGVASLVFVAAAGGLAYVYSDELRSVMTGTEVASVEPGVTPAVENPANTAPAADAQGEAAPTAPAAAPANTRQFTQRLQPDGTEVDAGPAEQAANAFDEGTDVASATLIQPPENPPAETPAAATPAAPDAAEAPAPATAEAAAEGAVPVGQRAVFYEERSATEAGSQHGGNVVWSVVNEPPADGQPAEPAIRAVADVPDENLRLTMTIRRNADETLPASHVIELLFDVPADFSGGEIANVQRLALKPTEQARGEPLIGVAGRISDGFFIIALNDLQQAVQSNLTLMGAEKWIDIPLAYSSGQRALMSLEKGLPGERVFKEAMDAWAART